MNNVFRSRLHTMYMLYLPSAENHVIVIWLINNVFVILKYEISYGYCYTIGSCMEIAHINSHLSIQLYITLLSSFIQYIPKKMEQLASFNGTSIINKKILKMKEAKIESIRIMFKSFIQIKKLTIYSRFIIFIIISLLSNTLFNSYYKSPIN